MIHRLYQGWRTRDQIIQLFNGNSHLADAVVQKKNLKGNSGNIQIYLMIHKWHCIMHLGSIVLFEYTYALSIAYLILMPFTSARTNFRWWWNWAIPTKISTRTRRKSVLRAHLILIRRLLDAVVTWTVFHRCEGNFFVRSIVIHVK